MIYLLIHKEPFLCSPKEAFIDYVSFQEMNIKKILNHRKKKKNGIKLGTEKGSSKCALLYQNEWILTFSFLLCLDAPCMIKKRINSLGSKTCTNIIFQLPNHEIETYMMWTCCTIHLWKGLIRCKHIWFYKQNSIEGLIRCNRSRFGRISN